MARLTNYQALQWAKEIAIAAMQGVTTPVSGDNGKDLAEFIQAVYDKLKDLDSEED